MLELTSSSEKGALKMLIVHGDAPAAWVFTLEQVYPVTIPLTWVSRCLLWGIWDGARMGSCLCSMLWVLRKCIEMFTAIDSLH